MQIVIAIALIVQRNTFPSTALKTRGWLRLEYVWEILSVL